MDTACRQLARWRKNPPTPDFTIGINVSARQFHEPRFVDDVRAALERTACDPRHLRLELTESMLLEDMEASMRTMAELKASGIRFSLDDFGTGYSSLAYLKSLPLDRLKIDQTFVRDMATDPNDAAIVSAIIGIANSLGLEVVAEGVETEITRQRLAELGCHQYQGYLFGRPVPATEFEALII
jgi:EAL domain-containing protein (putative c-di-GMP-specific phosphodiesterase class I)